MEFRGMQIFERALQAYILFSRNIKMKKVHYDSFEFNYRYFKRAHRCVYFT